MKTNIFMKSILRQPVRTLVFAVLIGIAAFAFVARAAEYVIVNNEIRRFEGLFPSIGVLAPVNPENFTDGHNAYQAAGIIAASPLLAFEDRRVFTQGVLHGRRNTVSHHMPRDFMVPGLEHIDIKVIDHYFYGTVINEPRLVRLDDMNFLMTLIDVDEHVVGDPMSLRAGTRVFTNERGQTVTVSSRTNFFLPLTPRETELYRQELFNPLGSLAPGEKFMFRGIVRDVSGRDIGDENIRWYLRPLGAEDGLRLTERPVLGWAGSTIFDLYIKEEIRDENLVFYVNASDGAALDAMLYHLRDDLYLADMNLSSVTVVGTADMTAIPRFTNPNHARLLHENGGRWLCHDDHVNANPVAVIPGRLATRSGLQVGDFFTITLRSNPRPAWIDRDTNSPWSLGTEGWWDSTSRGWWGLAETSHWRNAETYELTLEVAGIYWFFPPVGSINNFTDNEIFIPASLIPEGFGWCSMPLLTGMYSFTLNSARYQNEFVRQNGGAIEELGFTVGFLPSGFDVFVVAMAPTRTSIAINLAVFSAVSVLILTLVIFMYIKQWSKALAIVRALGMPTAAAMRRFFTPVFFIWVPAITVGAVAGWFFSLSQAGAALADVRAVGEEAYVNASVGLFLALFAGIVFLAVAGVISAGFVTAARPVLEQIQGNVQKVKKTKVIPVAAAPTDFSLPRRGFSTGGPLPTTNRAAITAGFRHITRRILRTPVKSVLAMVLALFFVISLSWMNHTIHFTEAEIARFMDTTVITADIVRHADDSRPIEHGFAHAYIGQDVIDALLHSGFVLDAYLEAVWLWGGVGGITSTFLGVSCLDGFVAENTRTPLDTQLGVLGDSMEIALAPGFTDFVFTPGQPVPVVMRQSTMAYLGLEFGDTIVLYDASTTVRYTMGARWAHLALVGDSYGTIVGYFTGGLNRAVNRDDNVSVIVPESFLRHAFADHPFFVVEGWNIGAITYRTARFYINPARNRELDRLPDIAAAQLSANLANSRLGTVQLELLVHDDILSTVVEPMEQNLALLRTLYPISIVVAIVLGFGLSLLIMLMNIKNAAIMRVLGIPKAKTRFSLWIEQVIVCADGAIIGLVVLIIIGVGLGAMPLALAGVYFTGAALGSAVGAFIISAKPPLELLQVRE